MPIQTTYSRYHDQAYEGMIADQQSANFFSKRAAAAIGFGKAVLQGATDDACKAVDGSAARFLGVTVRDLSTGADSPDQFKANDAVRIIDQGTIWVVAGENVAAGDRAAYLTADGSFKKATTADTTAIDSARFDSTAASGALVKLKLK
ncbi:MAG: hypothetical protein IPK75_12755 [Acidobacteria bacterium]|nr:hypothetical protein [Acidobacteriota bacterium]